MIEESFFYLEDQREEQIRLKETNAIIKLSENNLQRFQIDVHQQKDRVSKYIPHVIKRADLGDGWFCRYSDNYDSHSEFQYDLCIFTVHGSPGNTREWQKLQKGYGNNASRWINFIVPGYDGQDQRRGTYTGFQNDIIRMIQKLLDFLKIKQIIFIGYSMGGYVMYSFIDQYPEMIQGLVYMATPPINWQYESIEQILKYLGIQIWYRITVVEFEVNKMSLKDRQIFLNDNKYRSEIYQKYLELNPSYNIENVPVVTYQNQFQLFAWLKLVKLEKSNGFSEIFHTARTKVPSVLKFMAHGLNDPIIEKDLACKCFYYNIYGPNRFDSNQNSSSIMKEIDFQNLQSCQNYDINFQNLQENFIFILDQTGHTIHAKHGDLLGEPLRCYVEIVNQFFKIQERDILKKSSKL